MAQQKSKKSSTPWFQCDKCLTSLLSKDSEIHVEDCPPNINKITYNFVKENVLYGSLDVKVNEDIKNLSSKDKDNLVFLSQGVIQLCSLSIGEWCVVRLLNNSAQPPIAKIVWPTSEKTLTSVLLTKNCLDLSFLQACQPVSVSRLDTSKIEVASLVTLVVLNGPKSFEITSELNNRIHKTYSQRILAVGNTISLMFYGKILKFDVKVIEGCSEQTILEKEFAKLNISNRNEFYQITDVTKWKLYRDHTEYKKNNEPADVSRPIAGLDDEMQEIREIMLASLEKPKINSLTQCRSILLYGNSGTGKTLLANTLAKESKANIITISAVDLYSKYVGNAEETIKELFTNAIEQAPSVIILDEVDVLCSSRTNRMTDADKRIISTMLIMFDKLNEIQNSRVFIIATTNKPDNIDPAFRRCGRLDREIEIPTPSPMSRKKIIEKMLENVPNDLNQGDVHEIAMNTHGFVGSDLVALCSRAGTNSLKRNARVNFDDFKLAMKSVRPSAMREVLIEVTNVKWTDIGGQENLKLILKQSVEWPLKHPESFIRLGITPPRGVLMFGPPGCSKTMIAKALATESGLNFLSIKGPELFSKWVGESEKAVREVFRKARQVAPSIVFFDEIDALGGERTSGSSTSVQERVLAQLLTELDGVTPLGDVTVVAATNRPDRIDKALLRPGRLDRIVYVPLPDQNTRREIFKLKTSKMPVVDVNTEKLVELTEGYSGAEVNAVCHEAAMMALEESLEAQHVESRHFLKALTLITPRSPASLIQIYEDYLKIKI